MSYLNNKEAQKQQRAVKTYERMQNKEYTKTYLNKKRTLQEEPNHYPVARLILIKDFFRAKDLYKAIGLFLGVQITIMLIAAGIQNPNMAGAMNLLAILLNILLIVTAIREINHRQRQDLSRRRFNLPQVFGILICMILAIIGVTTLYNIIGVTMEVQPNQESLDSLVTQFPLAMIFTMVVVSPIVEETVFRELLPYATGPSYISFVIASLIFVALHAPFGLIGWTTYGILAAAFLWARLVNNNVYTAIAVHMIWNAISVLL